MQIPEDFHVHSSFSDGKASPEEIINAALRIGMTSIGFSDHSYTPFDLEPCMPFGVSGAYQQEIRRLQNAYAGRISVFCGVEQDLFSGAPEQGYDYVIGSVHYIHGNGKYYAVDNTPEELMACRDEVFHGDIYALAEEYFRLVSGIVDVTHCTIIGHFDLIRKLNGRLHLFDPAHPRYVAAWKDACAQLIRHDIPFEINTGGISRGYCEEAYPSREICRFLQEQDARFILSSDSHIPENLLSGFDSEQKHAQASCLHLIRFSEILSSK